MIKLLDIKDKYYYHIQRDNIDEKSKWNVGKQISISSYENYYYKNFNTRKLGIKIDDRFQYTYKYIKKQSKIRAIPMTDISTNGGPKTSRTGEDGRSLNEQYASLLILHCSLKCAPE